MLADEEGGDGAERTEEEAMTFQTWDREAAHRARNSQRITYRFRIVRDGVELARFCDLDTAIEKCCEFFPGAVVEKIR